MRIIFLVLFNAITFYGAAQEKADSLQRSPHYIGLGIDFMGIGYHGYDYPWENSALSISGDWIGECAKSTMVRPYLSLGFGATTIHPIGYATVSANALFGRGDSFFRVGGAVATAFTEHEVYWHITGYNGGVSGVVKINWGMQWMVVVGYTFLSQRTGFSASAYFSPHFAFKTYDVPGTVERLVWPSVGLSVGYHFNCNS